MKHLFLSIICLSIVCNAANARKATGEVTCQGEAPMQQVSELSPIHIAELKAKYEPTGKKPKDYRLTKKAIHYYAAEPSDDAKEITVVIKNRFGKIWKETIQLNN